MAERDTIRVEVVYAESGRVWSRTLALLVGTSAAVAVADSGFAAAHPKVHVGDDCLGVFGHRVKPGHVLRDGDRVEIYRPLLLDPIQARRQRARSPG